MEIRYQLSRGLECPQCQLQTVNILDQEIICMNCSWGKRRKYGVARQVDVSTWLSCLGIPVYVEFEDSHYASRDVAHLYVDGTLSQKIMWPSANA
jgi:hypothetical protein